VASKCRRDHHQLRLGRYLYGLSDAGARGVDRKIEGLDTDRSVHARPLGMAGESRRIRLRGKRDRQHDVALGPRSAGSPGQQLRDDRDRGGSDRARGRVHDNRKAL
jgi:hypothetical protein